MTSSVTAVFIHDTRRIIAANDAFCELFRCERLALIDLEVAELVAFDDLRGLARLRLKIMREKGPPLPNIKFPFRRCDDSTVFWASVFTRQLNDGNFETTLVYEYEE